MVITKSIWTIVTCLSFAIRATFSFVLPLRRLRVVVLHSTRKKDIELNLTQQNWDLGGTFENYSNSLSMTPTQQQQNVEDELAVYSDARNKRRPSLKKLVQIAHKVSIFSFLPKRTKKKGTLIFVRGVRTVYV